MRFRTLGGFAVEEIADAEDLAEAAMAGAFGDRVAREHVDEAEEDADAEDDIDDGEYLSADRVRRKIAETDGGEGCDAEVQRIQPAPAFKVMVRERAEQQYRARHDEQDFEFRVPQTQLDPAPKTVESKKEGRHVGNYSMRRVGDDYRSTALESVGLHAQEKCVLLSGRQQLHR